MRRSISEKIKAKDRLAALFNAYLDRLADLELCATPTGSMKGFRRLFTDAPAGLSERESEQAKHLLAFIPQFYHLRILFDSLNSLHRHVINAIQLLDSFFAEYGGDLTRYAIANRLHSIAEWGSDEDSDWCRTDEANESEPWKVVFKDDAESLAPYTLGSELAVYFADSEEQSERIGTSQAVDFACYTRIVDHATTFDLFKALASTGQEIPTCRQNESGELVRQSLGELTENQLNDELMNRRVAAQFEQTLDALSNAAALYPFATDAADYAELLAQLQRVRDCQGLDEPATPFND